MASSSNSSGMKRPTIIGIDLAGSPKRNTGMCTMRSSRILRWATLHTDDEILSYVADELPSVIAIDAPLTLPPGRKTIDDRNGEHFRPCDRELLKRGIRFFPVTLGPMRTLTKRGMTLAKKLRKFQCDVIEIYPGAAQDVWNIARKQDGLNKLRRGLTKLGVRGVDKQMNGDELDAVTGALVGEWFVRGKTEILGGARLKGIVMPLQNNRIQSRKRKMS
jgi:uncharacterized protein